MHLVKFIVVFVFVALALRADGARISMADYLNLIIPYFQFRNVHVLTHLGCFSARKIFTYG